VWSRRATLAPGRSFKLCKPSSARPIASRRCSNFYLDLQALPARLCVQNPPGALWSRRVTLAPGRSFELCQPSSARPIASRRCSIFSINLQALPARLCVQNPPGALWSRRVTLAPGRSFELCQPSSARPIASRRCSIFSINLQALPARLCVQNPPGAVWSRRVTLAPGRSFELCQPSSALGICSTRPFLPGLEDFHPTPRFLSLVLYCCRHLLTKASPGVPSVQGATIRDVYGI
jgi:hypothetical protein